jgi:serine/threonine protein phosphatase PrpC
MEQNEVKTIEPKVSTNISYVMWSAIGGRSEQQDSMFADSINESVLAVICDGMGGYKGGERASGIAVQLLAQDYYQNNNINMPKYYRDMAVKLDQAVYELKDGDKHLGAGTTIVSIYIKGNELYWLSVGDSKIYLWRRGTMLCPVKPHNYRQMLQEYLEEGKISEEKYCSEVHKGEALTSYLGIGGIKRMEINSKPFLLEKRDQILLCSDGLYKSLSEEDIMEILSLQMPIEAKAKKLVDEALLSGGANQDNTSVVLINV